MPVSSCCLPHVPMLYLDIDFEKVFDESLLLGNCATYVNIGYLSLKVVTSSLIIILIILIPSLTTSVYHFNFWVEVSLSGIVLHLPHYSMRKMPCSVSAGIFFFSSLFLTIIFDHLRPCLVRAEIA